jgi:hypothetical protein
MASLEGIRAPTQADSDAPAGCTARHRHWLWLRARKGPGVRLLFDLLSSCSGLLKHAAATTPAAVTIPPLTFNVRHSCMPRVGPLCSRCGTGGSRRDGSYCRVRHRRRPIEVAAARGAVAVAEGDAETAYRCCGIPFWGAMSMRRAHEAG